MSILCVAVLGLLAQGPTEELSARDALARFDALPVLRQAMLVRRLEQKVALADDPAVRRIASLRLDPGVPLPDAPAPVWFDPAEWAPVAPERRVAPPSDPRHRAVRAAMPEVTVMPDLARGVRYDWRTGSIIRARSLGWRERFANLAHGYPPGADEAYARVLAALDRDPLQRRLADYFEHLYADRDGTVWEGVTLYEAWYAGRTMEMPDVDAIAFAVQILGDRSFVSPIPADARREKLYATIRDAALRHRRYRTMLEAAAAAFVRAAPDMDPTYARLVPRFHYLFAAHDDDLAAVAAALDKVGTRDELVAAVDHDVVTDSAAAHRRDDRREEIAAMERWIRAEVAAALAAEEGRAEGK